MLLILCCVIAYLLGSIPFSYIIGKRVRGIDLRDHGSGNLGATNVWRTLGPGWGGLCLLLDMAKGAAAVVLMTILVNAWPEGEPTPLHFPPDLFRVIAAFLAAIGNLFFQLPALGLAVSSMFILLMAGLILYQTQQIIRGGETNYIMATVTLFVSMFNLFTSLLHILGFGFGED